ncbi:MAG: ABC transporter ATP-binding protein [Bradyrhizobium sp.]
MFDRIEDPPKIEVSHVGVTYRTKSRQDVAAIDDVSLTVASNEFIALIGPSGCGKSTLLNILAGFVVPTAGVARIDGEQIAGPSIERGYVFQEFALFPWKTVQQNVEFGLKTRGLSKQARSTAALRYLELVGLSSFAGSYPRELSGGMRQRVAIARAYAPEPEILLMDEPFGNLDALSRGEMQIELRDLSRRDRKTVVMVTHSVEEAIALADRIVVLTRRPAATRAVIQVAGVIDEDEKGHRETKSPEFLRMKEEVLAMAHEELSAQSRRSMSREIELHAGA